MKKLVQHCRGISGSRPRGQGCYPQPVYGPTEIQKSQMLNGMQIVAAKVSGALVTGCTVMFQAGSRFETNDDLGASHFIRAMSSGSGSNSSEFEKLRVLQQQGAYLTCTSDRQTLAFTLRCPLPLFTTLKGYLVDVAARFPYHQWEINDRKRLVRGDLARIHPEQRVLDLVQSACWSDPLGNSLFCEEGRIDSMTTDKLINYANLRLRSTLCAVASVGISFEETVEVAEMIDSSVDRVVCEPCCNQPTFRSGIETYDLGSGSDTWVACAVRGCGTNNVHNLFTHAIIASACGAGNIIQGQHRLDRTPQGPVGYLSQGDIYAEYRAFNISYSDTGVFGIISKTKAEAASCAASLASDFLVNVSKLSSEQIAEGKHRLQMDLALHDEDAAKCSQGFATQAINCADIGTVESCIAVIDAISDVDVFSAATTLASNSNQMAIAIVGDVGAVPTEMFFNM